MMCGLLGVSVKLKHLILSFKVYLFCLPVNQLNKKYNQEDNAFFDFLYLLGPVCFDPVEQVRIIYPAQGHLSM